MSRTVVLCLMVGDQASELTAEAASSESLDSRQILGKAWTNSQVTLPLLVWTGLRMTGEGHTLGSSSTEASLSPPSAALGRILWAPHAYALHPVSPRYDWSGSRVPLSTIGSPSAVLH